MPAHILPPARALVVVMLDAGPHFDNFLTPEITCSTRTVTLTAWRSADSLQLQQKTSWTCTNR